jgi:amino acid permease
MKGERKLHHQQDDSSFSPSIRHRMAGHARGSAGGEVSAQLGASPYDGHAAAGYYASGSTWVNAGSAQQQQQQQLQQGMHARHSGAGACGSHAAPPSAACDPPPGSKAVSAYSGAAHGGRASTKATFLQSWINLATCVLGAGALGYPFCFKECGLLLATVIMLLTLVATRVSYQLLLYCAQLSGRKTYEGIAEHALGRAGRQAVELCIAAMNLGALVAFLDILADVLSSVAGTIIPPGAEPSRHAYITGVTLLGALPVSLLVREPSLVASMSNAAVVFVVVFAVLVFCTAFGPSAAAALGVRWAALTGGSVSAAAARAARAPVLHLWNPQVCVCVCACVRVCVLCVRCGVLSCAAWQCVAHIAPRPCVRASLAAAWPTQHPVVPRHTRTAQGVLVSLPVMAYGFTAHQYYMGIYTMLSAPTVRKMKRVTDAALLVCAAVYWTVGVGGYATFGDRTSGDIVRNFGGAHSQGVWGAYERALKLCYGMAVLGNIPLVIMPFGSILAPLLPGDEALQQQARQVAAACSVKGARRATAAALSGCSGSGASGARGPLGAGAGERLPLLHTQPLAPKARSSSSGGGASAAAAPASAHHMDHGAAGSPGVLQQQQGRGAATLDVQLPAWHDSSSQQLQQQQQQKQQRHPAQLWQQHQQEQLQEQRPLLAPLPAPPPRCSSPDDDVPQHPHLTQGAARVAHMLTGPQHTLVVVLVLGVGLASAVWLPNVELIFGLTGSTASVLAAFIMPAVCFLRLYEMAPELGAGLGAARRHPYGGGGAISSSSVLRLLRQLVCCCDCCGLGAWLLARVHGGGSGSRPRRGGDAAWHASPRASGNGSGTAAASAHKVWGPVLVVPELRAQWACRQRLALLLLVFGIISGLLCTDAMLSSISEEKAVVQLAQVRRAAGLACVGC